MSVYNTIHEIYPCRVEKKGTEDFSCIPTELVTFIFTLLDVKGLHSASSVCKKWHAIAKQKKIEAICLKNEVRSLEKIYKGFFFGFDEWNRYIGQVDKEPPLTKKIVSLLKKSCPQDPEKKIAENWKLILMPALLDGEKFTLRKLINRAETLNNIYHRIYFQEIEPPILDAIGERSFKRPYWILILKKECYGCAHFPWRIPKFFDEISEKIGCPAEVPSPLEATTFFVADHILCAQNKKKFEHWRLTVSNEEIEGQEVTVGNNNEDEIMIDLLDNEDEKVVFPVSRFFEEDA